MTKEKPLKVVAFSGSARRDGNTAFLVKTAFGPLKKAGVETELVQLAGQPIRGCRACYACFKNKNRKCPKNTVFDPFTKQCLKLSMKSFFCCSNIKKPFLKCLFF